MTREELMNLGIREDVAEGVLQIHAQEVEAERGKGEEAFQQLNDACGRIQLLEAQAAALAELTRQGARQPELALRLLDPSREALGQIQQLRQASPYLFGGGAARGGMEPIPKPPSPAKRGMNDFLRRR